MKVIYVQKPGSFESRAEYSHMPITHRAKRDSRILKRPGTADDVRAFAAIMTITFGAAALGILFGAQASADWYVSLVKPSWIPPSQVFAAVWTALYAMMGLAAWRVYRKRDEHNVRPAMMFYHLQLVLNVLWCVFFFGMHNPALALADAMLLQLFIISSAASFFQIDRPASALLIPYMSWVAFAICLNCFIWVAN